LSSEEFHQSELSRRFQRQFLTSLVRSTEMTKIVEKSVQEPG